MVWAPFVPDSGSEGWDPVRVPLVFRAEGWAPDSRSQGWAFDSLYTCGDRLDQQSRGLGSSTTSAGLTCCDRLHQQSGAHHPQVLHTIHWSCTLSIARSFFTSSASEPPLISRRRRAAVVAAVVAAAAAAAARPSAILRTAVGYTVGYAVGYAVVYTSGCTVGYTFGGRRQV